MLVERTVRIGRLLEIRTIRRSFVVKMGDRGASVSRRYRVGITSVLRRCGLDGIWGLTGGAVAL